MAAGLARGPGRGRGGDRNPCTPTPAAAKASRFGEIIVQGGITSAILNAVVAESLPGPGTIFLNVNRDFKAPVRPGDVITGRVEILEARTDKPITKLRTTVIRGHGSRSPSRAPRSATPRRSPPDTSMTSASHRRR